jgi:DNA-directed RNA polymerase subunit L
MDENKKKQIQFYMRKEDIMTFINGLHEIQMEMIDEAVEKSGYKDAKEVIERIKELK